MGADLHADGVVRPRPGDEALLEAWLVPPAPENHASFLHRMPDGGIAAAWFAGSAEGRPDAYIHVARLSADGARWGEAVRVSADEERSEQNPVLATLPDGTVWLLYTAQDFGAQDTAQVLRQVSGDGGATWGAPEAFVRDRGMFIRQDLVVLDASTWLLPVFRCRVLPGRQWRGDSDVSAVLRTQDAGRTWTEVAVPDSDGLVHMDIVPQQDGTALAFFRSRWADHVYRSESRDGGLTWASPVALTLPNNNSSIQVRGAVSPDGHEVLLAVLNPVGAPEGTHLGDAPVVLEDGKITAPGDAELLDRHAVWGQPRLPLDLLVSADRGDTWQTVVRLESEETLAPQLLAGSGTRDRELSYPALVVDDGGDVHVTYTYGRQAIKYVRVPATRWQGLVAG